MVKLLLYVLQILQLKKLLFKLFSYDISEFSEKDIERDGCFHGYDVSEYTLLHQIMFHIL